MTRGTNERQPVTNQVIPEEAVESAYAAWMAHKTVRSPGNAKDAMREALEAATPHILAMAADALEARMEDATDAFEDHYVSGYADAIARLLMMNRTTK